MGNKFGFERIYHYVTRSEIRLVYLENSSQDFFKI